MATAHTYEADVVWTGDLGVGTASYTSYSRDHDVRLPGRPVLPGSADPAFRGDPTRYSPEELLLAALSQCHLLWFLHLAASAGVVVLEYADHATGTMTVAPEGHGEFTEVVLHPAVTVASPGPSTGADTGAVTDADVAALHERAHHFCFIARSVRFPVRHEPAGLRLVDIRR